MESQAGPDIPEILCYVPDGCCGAQACQIDLDTFICAVRSLAPEGDIYNLTQPSQQVETDVRGVTTVGCARVGCEQLVLGSCCPPRAIPCKEEPIAPQLAMIDAFAAVAFTAIKALCALLKELDPCTAEASLKCWAERFNIKGLETCPPDQWSDALLKYLVCLLSQLRMHVMNWDFLTMLGRRFGACMVMRWAGDFSECHPAGWWTMARMPVDCPEQPSCPPLPEPPPGRPEMIRLVSTCWQPPPSLNIIHCPCDIIIPPNCNLKGHQQEVTLPHDPELYKAWTKWLLPSLLPLNAQYCLYECDPDNCIV